MFQMLTTDKTDGTIYGTVARTGEQMQKSTTIKDRIAEGYDDLSDRLRAAADFVADNPVDVATRSLRSISTASGLAPATFSRLARALGFDDYEAMRELSRSAVGRRYMSFSQRAQKLQSEAVAGEPLLQRQVAACMANIDSMSQTIDPERLERAVEALHNARRVVLFGACGSTGLIDYMAYMGRYFSPDWQVAGRGGAALGATMSDLSARDTVLIITKPPFARRAILSAEMAAAQGAAVIVLSDTHTCPALKYATAGFILPSDSPQFFSSYAATLVLVETIIGMLVARAGPDAMNRIAEVEARNHRLEEYWRV